MLTAEFAAGHLPRAQVPPQMIFGVGHVVAQFSLQAVVDD
jgi:hypothetical protein